MDSRSNKGNRGNELTKLDNAPTIQSYIIAAWDGSWSALGSGMNGTTVYALAMSGGLLYAGGDFTTAGGVPANRIAAWDGSS